MLDCVIPERPGKPRSNLPGYNNWRAFARCEYSLEFPIAALTVSRYPLHREIAKECHKQKFGNWQLESIGYIFH